MSIHFESVIIPAVKTRKGFTVKQKELEMTGIFKACEK
jgi:hypothetical protein